CSSSRRAPGCGRACTTSTPSRAAGGTSGTSGRADRGGVARQVTLYLGRRALHSLIVLLVVTLAAFMLIQLVPGDPARIMLGAHAPPASVRQVRHELGLDRSLLAQFGSFLGGIPRGDLGTSINLKRPVGELIGPRIGPSL